MIKYMLAALALVTTFSVKAQDAQTLHDNYRSGVASFYHDKFEGRKTATGEIFDNNKFTAASNTHKLGTYVKVTNIKNGKIIYVKINDRMAASNKRLIDLASIAAKNLGFHQSGLTQVKVEPVSKEEGMKGIIAQREQRDAQNKL